jgi:hypothetical protein
VVAGGAIILHGIVNIAGEEEEFEHDGRTKDLEIVD